MKSKITISFILVFYLGVLAALCTPASFKTNTIQAGQPARLEKEEMPVFIKNFFVNIFQ